METITEVVTQAELRRRARVRDEYRRRVGPLHEWDVEADEVEWPTPAIVRDLQAALRVADTSQALGLRHLFRFTIGEYLLRQTHRSSATIQDRQQSAVVEVPILDEPVPFWQVSARLALERKRVLREALDSTATSLIQGFHPLYRQFWTGLFASSKPSDIRTSLPCGKSFSGVRLDAFLQPLEAILRDTEDTYRERMQWHLKRALGIDWRRPSGMISLPCSDGNRRLGWFPRAEMLPCLAAMAATTGAGSPKTLGNLRIEQYRDGRRGVVCASGDPRQTFAWPWPHRRGCEATASLSRSREGHTPGIITRRQFRANSAVFPTRLVLEAQAELYGGLIRTPRWVQIYRHIQQSEEGLSLARLERLYLVRRYIGKCLYERTFYEDSVLDGKEEAYRDALRRACGFTYPESLLSL